jgi:hypothetical protein
VPSLSSWRTCQQTGFELIGASGAVGAAQADLQREQKPGHDQDETDQLRCLTLAHGLRLPVRSWSVPLAPSRGQ